VLEPDLPGFSIDLVIYDRSPRGNPDKPPPRALIEFKGSPSDVNGDRARTKLLLSKMKSGVFGFVVAHPVSFDVPSELRSAIEAARKIGPCTVKQFDQPIGNGETLHGAVIGFPIEREHQASSPAGVG
jgi:hypothetical protein